ncbi:coiled-coil domain-containing protein 89-like [Lineus longissimus]|uniref:coiled-coil domain-containing protein 89-like n=1 Tax=Lineus longissimus TaxID=88925 RepID=UPI002B4E77DA
MSSKKPQDLQQMVDSSQKDLNQMQTNLEKLRNLSHDDKTENAMLRSRIDEQSQLIMILKNRADENLVRVQTLEKCNNELEKFRESATEKLKREMMQFNMLSKRFDDLAGNHEEMIKYKDEYKRQNEFLRRENERILDENKRLFSKAIEEKDAKISEMDKRIMRLRDQYNGVDTKYRVLEEDMRVKDERYRTELKSLQSKLKDTEERLKGTTAKLNAEMDKKQNSDFESAAKYRQLMKEKDELLTLAMHRGKLIQDKQTENKKLEMKIEEMERMVRRMEEKFEKEAEAVNTNLTVRRLKTDVEEADKKYSEIVREFSAFKKHSNSLLQKEKDLNAKLRHLVG